MINFHQTDEFPSHLEIPQIKNVSTWWWIFIPVKIWIFTESDNFHHNDGTSTYNESNWSIFITLMYFYYIGEFLSHQQIFVKLIDFHHINEFSSIFITVIDFCQSDEFLSHYWWTFITERVSPIDSLSSLW